ncbi:VirB4 family type IV secretion/conjugal transfer ATPase [Caulobacter sp. RHG1]|uniref:VirB4 family type IV secretion/conjugal transfer ATPase n=1 Tax=Caulobacter sp. (strain RHG1) TaxID=2545762 RepID=UPI00155655D7|nr:VirB4 family type IV secretion/conjugal transfer ATPase [Caulobacter sp. RHG1]NQE63595.1 ATPase required for both assembly of type IV secretion complex and secretion of T-DNA complex [Caulobacter sp. RHG1]
MSSGLSLWRREPTIGGHLPYLAQIDDTTLMLRDGGLMQVIRLDGLPFETSDSDDLNHSKQLRDATLRALASSRFAIHHHVVRRPADPVQPGVFPDPFSQALDTAWTQRMNGRPRFQNDLFISIVRRPLRGRGRWAQWLAAPLLGADITAQATLATEVKALSAARDALIASLSAYGARALGAYDAPGGPQSEILEFLFLLLNGEQRPVKLPSGDIGDHLAYRRLHVGRQALEFSPGVGGERTFAAVISLKDYPGASTPGMLDELLRLPVEMALSQSFAFVDRATASDRVNTTLRRMRAADDEALSLRDELAIARDDLAAGRAAFGEHHLTITIRADSLPRLDEAVAEVQAALADLGMIAVREDIGLEPAFWAQFPGNTSYITRRALISTRNFAGLASSHNFSMGRRDGLHWAAPVSVLETTAASPYLFNFHHGDLGNFTVIGPSGSGKTVVLNFLLAQARRFDPQIMFFDKDRGAELFLRAIGGRYNVLRPGEPSGLNPLALPDTARDRRFLTSWIAALVADGGALDPEDVARIEDAVAANFAAPPHLRRLGAFADLLRGGERPHGRDLHARLRPWFGKGEHAWLFDNAVDAIDPNARILGFDMTRVLDDPSLRSPAMMYLFHRVEERLDGAPAIIVIEEAWKALDDPAFRSRIRDWEKTIRKRNGLIGFVTQSAEDALKSEIAADIVEQAATQIFMPNPKGQSRDYVGGFGLTPYEFDLVRALPSEARCFLIKQGGKSAVVRLDLEGEGEMLTILSGRERTVRLLDEIRTRTGDAPEAWMRELLAVA